MVDGCNVFFDFTSLYECIFVVDKAGYWGILNAIVERELSAMAYFGSYGFQFQN